jgi:hypothetical protein
MTDEPELEPPQAEDEPTQAVVYRYGTDPRTPIPPEVDEQLVLVHSLRHDLVTIEEVHEEARRELQSTDITVAAAEDKLAAAQLTLDTLIERAKTERVTDRSKRTRPSTAALIAEARAARKQAREDRKAAVAAARARLRPAEKALREQRDAAVKATYRPYCDRGLHWATWNDVIMHHRISRGQVIRARTQGHPARHRRPRRRDEGTISVQLQWQSGMPRRARTPQLLASGGGRWSNTLQFRGQGRGAVVRWYVGGGRHVTIPVVAHRPLPEAADVAHARLTVWREAGRRRLAVSITCYVPVPTDPDPDLPAVMVAPRWHRRRGGQLVAAEWESTAPLPPPPADLDAVVVDPGGCTGLVLTPGRGTEGRLVAAEKLRSVRDQHLDTTRAALCLALSGMPAHVLGLPEHVTADDTGRPRSAAQVVAAWRAPARFAALCLRWRTGGAPDGLGETAAMLERWRRVDRARWEAETHMRRRAVAHRRDTYRRAAAWLTESCSRVDVAAVPVADLTRHPAIGAAVAGSTEQADAARRQRQIAAPSDLTGAVKVACRARGVASGEVRASPPGAARGQVGTDAAT